MLENRDPAEISQTVPWSPSSVPLQGNLPKDLPAMPSGRREQNDPFLSEETPKDTFPYRIHERAGSGAMGVVYRATDVVLERTVAIKTLHPEVIQAARPEEQDEIRRRFLQEARATAALAHPGVPTVFQVGKEHGLPYMVMEWLEGSTLEEVLREQGKLPITEAIRLTIELLDVLEAVHRSGVVHRDIKPSNLIILDDGQLKLTDFGIAWLCCGRELVPTRPGMVLATPKFASPEQIRGTDVDGRSDLFAVGILLFHLLSGSFPFQGRHFMKVASAILEDEPMPLRELDPSIPEGVEAVVRRALCKDRDGRFVSAGEMADELRDGL